MTAPLPQADSRLLRLDRNVTTCLRLCCFHHAGGNAWGFREWAEQLPDWVEVHAVQLPGRGVRRSEPAQRRLAPLASAVRDALPAADKPSVFFGHSLGGLVAFEVIRQLERARRRAPLRLYVAATPPPHVAQSGPLLHELDEQQLVAALRETGGIPAQLLDHPELLEALLPTLHADLELAETYSCDPDDRVHCAISVFGARDDLMIRHTVLRRWRELTQSRFTLRMLPGDHFLKEAQPQLLAALRRDLEGLLKEIT